MADCVYRQWFLEVFLGPFSNVNDRIMPMSDAVSSEGPKTTGIQQRSSALSLTHRDFSSFSESFDDVMHCRSEVPNHWVATHYGAMEEFLPGHEKVLGKMCIDMTLCYLLCVNYFSNYSVFSLYAIDI